MKKMKLIFRMIKKVLKSLYLKLKKDKRKIKMEVFNNGKKIL